MPGKLLQTFLIGSLGTIFGTFIAYFLVPMRSIASGKKIAAALCARHIGGAVNFVAVSELINIDAEVVAAALAADNIIVAVYFAFLFLISANEKEEDPKSVNDVLQYPIDLIERMESGNEVNLSNVMSALSLSLGINLASKLLSSVTPLSPMILLSSITVFLATLMPKQFSSIIKSGTMLGSLFMQFFFSVTGAMGYIPLVLKVAPQLLLHTAVQITAHFLFLYGICSLQKRPLREIVLASNANVGGPTTASAMAANKQWKASVLPALLLGIFGFAIATQIGVIMYHVLLRFP